MNLIEDLKWRYASKRMNGKKVPQEKVDKILEAINLAPTSLGLQAFKVLVIEDQSLKEKIFAEACQQVQVKECSHLLIFAPYTDLTEEIVDEFIAATLSVRNMTPEWGAKYKDTINYFIDKNSANLGSWLTHQTYIALGFACAAAANERVDSVPIEGFDSKALDQLLNLDKKGLKSAVLFPIGYREEDADFLANAPKVRKKMDDLVEFIQ